MNAPTPASRCMRTRAMSRPGRCEISTRPGRTAGAQGVRVPVRGGHRGRSDPPLRAAVGDERVGAPGRVRMPRCVTASMKSSPSAARGTPSASSSSSTPTASSIKLADLALRERLGSTAKFPRWATAFKFAAQQQQTKLLRIDVERRPHRRQHTVRRAGAGLRRGLHGVHGDAAQRRGHRPERPARRRHRRHREGRGRHPQGRGTRARPPAARLDALGDADRVQGLRKRAEARRGRSRLAVRERVLSRPASAGASNTSPHAAP